MGNGVSRRGKRRRRRATAGPAAPAGRGARAPLVGHLEAQQPVARWEMPGVPTQTRRAKDAAVAQVAGDPRVPDGDRRADRMAHVGRPRTARGRRLRRRAGQNGDGRPCSGAAQRHRIPSGSAGPCASIIASTISEIASGERVADALGSRRAAWYDVLAVAFERRPHGQLAHVQVRAVQGRELRAAARPTAVGCTPFPSTRHGTSTHAPSRQVRDQAVVAARSRRSPAARRWRSSGRSARRTRGCARSRTARRRPASAASRRTRAGSPRSGARTRRRARGTARSSRRFA